MPSDVVSEELQDNFLKCFSVIHKCQYIFGSLRVIINDKIAEPPADLHNLYSFIIFLLASFSEGYLQMVYIDLFYNRNLIMYWTCLLGNLSEYVSYVLCMYMVRFAKREANVNIYSMLGKLDRLLDLQCDSYFNDFQARVQNVLLMLILVIFPIGIVIHNALLMDKVYFTVFLCPALLTLYIDLLLCGGFLYYIAVRLSVFNKMFSNHNLRYETVTKHEEITLLTRILGVVIPNYEHVIATLDLNLWCECVREILKAYKMVQHIFSFQVFNLTVTVMLWTFIAISAMVVGLRSGLYPPLGTAMIGAWALFYYVLLTFAALLNYWFLHQVKTTKRLCIRVMSFDNHDSYQKAASEILRIINYSDPKFQVYGIFCVDISLPLTIIGIIATNILVCVQFIVDRV